MNQLHEIINYNEKLPVRLFVHHQGSFPVHWHSSIEIQMLLSGSSKVTASGIASELKEGDLILLNGNELHDISSEGCVALVLQFRADLFDERYVRQGLHFSCNSSVSSEPWRYKPLKVILANMVKLNADGNEGNELLTLSLLYQLMHLLIEGFRTQGSPSMVSIDKKNRNRMKGIVDYLEENFMEPLSLQTIAAREFLSPTYFSSFFEHNMGVTFSSYLTALRLNHALNDLMYTSFTLEEIASRNGFPSSRAMSSAFKARFGILPSHYRTAHSNSARLPPSGQEEGYVLLAREDFLNSLAEYLDTPDVPAGKSKSICMNYSVQEVNSGTITARLRHTFKVMTTVGKARDLLDSNIRRMLEELQKEVGFTHIKFHGLLDDSMHLYNEDENGNIRFVYSYIDEVFDYLLGIGLKPMIQLSFMPSKLAERPDAAVFESHFIISPPKDLEKWKTLVSSLTLHLIKRYGMSEVSSWLFT
ncbi:MAG: helix-turn-helix domain-containing protein, partial [Clostridiales bacterium]|nr:helix-turn-helix domain-containing protein [Clostridiales bacterium]